MRIAVVGATGMVGTVMLQVLREENFPVTELIPVASEKSVGQVLHFGGIDCPVVGLQTAVDMKPDLAIFSAGGDTSLEWAPKFAAVGTTVIDNSSAWRMDPTKKLVVPEVNGHVLTKEDKIIANPNCSTIQLVLALAPLHKEYGVKRVVVSTYQSITGTGVKAVEQMENERNGIAGDMVYPYPIDKNCLPHCDAFLENGYTKEEMKMHWETQKILGDDSVSVNATAVRVPVFFGHAEAVHIETRMPISVEQVKALLADAPGVVLLENNADFPTQVCSAAGKDEVFVGRIRQDLSHENGINLWVVADNIRKGAATNSIQIAEHLIRDYL